MKTNIDCKSMSQTADGTTKEVVERVGKQGSVPTIIEIIATQNAGVISYSRTKAKKAAALGVGYRTVQFDPSTPQAEILEQIAHLNADPLVQGIMIGLPVYPHLSADKLMDAISPVKDVDGLSPLNTYYIATNQEHLAIAPATAVAAIQILEALTSPTGMRVLVIGRGRTVGRPVAAMLTNRNATVTVAHSQTRDLAGEVSNHDVIISAIGQPHFVRAEWFRDGQIVIDCGISFAEGKTVGDVAPIPDSLGVQITPVPGGVGTLTNSLIFGNLLRAIQLQSLHNSIEQP